MLTQNKLKELLNYDPETGIFTWKISTSPYIKVGRVTGTAPTKRYIQIGINRRYYLAHRLAWLWMTGSWPSSDIDHINTDRSDNRFSNLREATNGQNSMNRSALRNSKTGVKGVSWSRGSKSWKVQVTINKKLHHKSFKDFDDAVAAAKEMRERLHGEFARD